MAGVSSVLPCLLGCWFSSRPASRWRSSISFCIFSNFFPLQRVRFRPKKTLIPTWSCSRRESLSPPPPRALSSSPSKAETLGSCQEQVRGLAQGQARGRVASPRGLAASGSFVFSFQSWDALATANASAHPEDLLLLISFSMPAGLLIPHQRCCSQPANFVHFCFFAVFFFGIFLPYFSFLAFFPLRKGVAGGPQEEEEADEEKAPSKYILIYEICLTSGLSAFSDMFCTMQSLI